jgi:hypothetical protein
LSRMIDALTVDHSPVAVVNPDPLAEPVGVDF